MIAKHPKVPLGLHHPEICPLDLGLEMLDDRRKLSLQHLEVFQHSSIVCLIQLKSLFIIRLVLLSNNTRVL